MKVAKGKKVLLVKEAGAEAGKWNQPAGWLEKYENPILGAKREAEEEIGFKIKITHFLGIYSHCRKVKFLHRTKPVDAHPTKLLFIAHVISKGRAPDPKEIKEVKWFSLDEIKDLRKKKILRDPDIVDEVTDYLKGKKYDLKLVHHSRF